MRKLARLLNFVRVRVARGVGERETMGLPTPNVAQESISLSLWVPLPTVTTGGYNLSAFVLRPPLC